MVLDLTGGSGTTAYGRAVGPALDHDRHSARLARPGAHAPMSAVYPYYLLADSPGGDTKKENELARPRRRSGARKASFINDLRRGFVYERVPHITLKSIANNEEI